jgi:hypothetical protein
MSPAKGFFIGSNGICDNFNCLLQIRKIPDTAMAIIILVKKLNSLDNLMFSFSAKVDNYFLPWKQSFLDLDTEKIEC